MRSTQHVLTLVLAALPAATPAAPLRPDVHPVPLSASSKALQDGLDRPRSASGRLPSTVLVLPVEFPDEAHADNWSVQALDEAFFGGEGSVRDYYARSSFGRYTPTGVVQAWIRLSRTQAFYTDGSGGVHGSSPRNARSMVADLVRAADSSVDFSRFDNDGPDGLPSSGDDDGRVDALMVVHAGSTMEETGSEDRFLSHWWFTREPVVTDDGVVVLDYALVGEASPLGVRAHEFAHHLGLPDLYDRSPFASAPGGLGDWSLMASGVWLGKGDLPADLDAPSKIQLGFVDAVVPTDNATGLPLRAGAGQRPPDVYQLWTYGHIGDEFLVVTNRRRTGLDAALPGGGMLVYHVNLLQANNDNRDDLRVQLLQADGRADIESFRNNGDGGDPWPGTGVECCELNSETNPSTRARDGSDSQIVVSNISAPTDTMSFDLVVESRAFLRVARHVLYELEGDGDGVPEAGELLRFEVEIENLGLASAQADLSWRAEPETDATWTTNTAVLQELEGGESVTAAFELRAAAALADPSALRVVGEAVEAHGTRHALERTLALGEVVGFVACLDAAASSLTRDCSDPDAPWSVDVLRGDAGWSLEQRSGELGSVYRNVRSGEELYPSSADVALVSPAFNVEPGHELHLLHEYEIQELGAGWAFDGARVEISLHGGSWEALAPQRGYTHELLPEAVPHLAHAQVFSGRGSRRWDIFALGARSGSARVRFRFVSDRSIGATGWQLLRVEVRSPWSDPPPHTRLSVVAEPNPARFPARVVFRVSASRTVAAQSTRLLVYDVRGRLIRELVHAPVPAQSAQFIWDGMDHAGRDVPTGVYWTRLEWGRDATTTKLVVIR